MMRMWQRVVMGWAVLGAAAAQAADPRPVVSLSAQLVSGAGEESNVFGGLLCRELERQAFLLAARDELGLRTRDAALGEAPEEEGLALNVLTHNIRGERSLVVFTVPQKKGEKAPTGAEEKAAAAAGQAEFKLGKGLVDYALFSSETERQSRTDFVDLLRKAGAMRGQAEQPIAWGAGALSPEAAAALAEMNPYAQWTAVRLIHLQMRESGASPERLAALVQAYANLGFLTQFLWNADSKVFAARSLLYAERLVVHENKSPASLEARAYARAMAGLQRLAQEDLQIASTSPPWKPAIDAWCRYDADSELQEAREGKPCRQLAAILTTAIVRDTSGPDRVIDSATENLQTVPDSSYLRETIWHTDILKTALVTPDELMKAAPVEARAGIARLQLPAILKAADEATGDGETGLAAGQSAAMATALLKAGAAEDAEPSLGMLGQLVRDEAFVAAAEIAESARQRSDLDEEAIKAAIRAVTPAWQGHPNAAFVEAMIASDQGKGTALVTALKKWHPRDVGRWTYEDVFFDDSVYGRLGVNWYGDSLYALDTTALDYSRPIINAIRQDEDVKRLEAARRESPQSTLLFAGWMEHYGREKRREDPAAAEKIIADAEAHFAGRPRVMADAGEWACDLNEFSRGITMMAGAMKADPTARGAAPLVDAYLHVGDVDAAKQIADQALAVNNEEMLQREQIADKMARALLIAGRPDDAWFYAKFAADSDASWGYTIAASCQERMGNREETVKWLEANASLYPSTVTTWELWATRTQDGSLEEVKKLAAAYAEKHPDAADNTWSAYAEGDLRGALKAFAHDEKKYDVGDWAVYSTLAALAKDKRALEHGLTAMENSKKAFGVQLAAAARGNQIAFALDHLAVVREADWRDAEAPAQRAEAGYLLAATGHKAEALPLLKRAVHAGNTVATNYAMVCDALKRLGEDPAKLAAQPLPVEKTEGFAGDWKADIGAGQTIWSLGKDGSALNKKGERGGWRLEDGKLIVLFSSHEWAVFDAAGGPGRLTGSCDKGPQTATLSLAGMP